MGIRLGGRGVLESQINVVPMIDVLLVLIVIFMLLQGRFVFDVNLPSTERGPGPGAPEIVLELRSDGSYAINDRSVALDDLEDALRALYAERPRSLLFVRAARDRTYQEVVAAVDVARRAGVAVIGYMP